MENLPQNWIISTLGEVCTQPQYGYTTSGVDSGNLHLLRTTDITKGNINWETVPFCQENPEDEAKYLLKDGDIVISRAGSVGVSHLIKNPQKAVFASYLIRFRPFITLSYFKYFLDSPFYWQQISENRLGIAVPNVNATKLQTISIPLSPTNEQKRIVTKIEELFSELDNATKCLLAAKEQQKIFYQSVLDNAFSNCKEHKKLEVLLSQKLSNGYSGKPIKYETDYRVLSLSSTTSGVFLNSYFKFLDEPALEDRDIWCAPNDILIQRGNTIEYVGVPAIFTGEPRKFIFPDLMIRVRANENLISVKFLYYALSSPKIRNYLRRKAKGSAGTMPKINQSILNSLPIPFCSKEMQEKIVEDIEVKLSNGLAIERTIEEGLSKSEALRQSILKKAFSGKLVAQDPDDEPASVLLERISVEKEMQKMASKKPKAGNPCITQLDLIQI